MAVYCITYDLGEDGPQNYDGLIDEINAIGPVCEITKSTWLVSTSKSGEEIVATLASLNDSTDRLVVFDVGRLDGFVMTAKGTEDIIRWIGRHVPKD